MKIFSLIILVIFTFVAIGFCGDNDIMEDASRHCIICCGAGHCSYVIADKSIPRPHLTVSKAVISQDTSYQNLFVSGIDHPPKSSL